MKTKAGLWIDHEKAVIIMLTEVGEQVTQITSEMEPHVRFSVSKTGGRGSTEDIRDRQFANHLDVYYDKVIVAVREAEAVLILGPGEAKGELLARFERDHRSSLIVNVETAGKLTDPQIAAQVRQYFAG